MIELTASDAPRIFLLRADRRILISRTDSLIVLCALCGGALSLLLHVDPSKARLPGMVPCRCVSNRRMARDDR